MKLSLLGATGSIGTQTLEVMACHGLRPAVLTAGRNAALLERQARQFQPELVCLADEASGPSLRQSLADTATRVLYGPESILEAAAYAGADTVLNALVGLSGLVPTVTALENGKRLLLANKESLVYAGELVMRLARERGLPILPVDSEHSALLQALEGGRSGIRRIILTASGGPFRGMTLERLHDVTPAMALRHPNWSMGAKVSIDSATLLNKGLECIEAMWLFDMPMDKISVLLHPESIVHSIVEYDDTACIAQLGTPDMRLPIQYALLYPERLPGPNRRLDLCEIGALHFAEPDRRAFPCLDIARAAAERGGNAAAVMCAAGECAVEAFLAGDCRFTDIPERMETALARVPFIPSPSLAQLLDSDRAAREAID